MRRNLRKFKRRVQIMGELVDWGKEVALTHLYFIFLPTHLPPFWNNKISHYILHFYIQNSSVGQYRPSGKACGTVDLIRRIITVLVAIALVFLSVAMSRSTLVGSVWTHVILYNNRTEKITSMLWQITRLLVSLQIVVKFELLDVFFLMTKGTNLVQVISENMFWITLLI